MSSSLWRPQLRVPPAWSTGLVPRACTCRPPDSSDGALGELDQVLAAISARMGNGRRSVPLAGSRDCTNSDRPSDQEQLDHDKVRRPVAIRRPDPTRTELNHDQNRTQTRSTSTSTSTRTSFEPPSLAFCKVGLRPSLRPASRPVLGSSFLRDASRRASKGGVPPPWPHHTAHPPIGRGRATPSPFLTQYDEGRKIRAGDI